jgi:hypothetical protein
MSKEANTSPATKADIEALMDSIGKLYDTNERWMKQLLEVNERCRDELSADHKRLGTEMHKSMERFRKEAVDEITRHFDVVVENIRHDLVGANHDEVISLKNQKVNHEQRLLRLERTVGYAV